MSGISYRQQEGVRRAAHEAARTGPSVFCVVRHLGYDGDDYLFAFAERTKAEEYCALLNGVPYSRDEPEDYRVYDLAFVGHGGEAA